MAKIYLDNAIHYDAIGSSEIYAASFLHKIIFGRCSDDLKSQLYFSEKVLKFQPSEFVDVVTAICDGLEQLELLEGGKDDVEFEQTLNISKNYKLMATVGTDPKTFENKFHLRWYWLHGEDKEFQLKVAKGILKPLSPDEPIWKPTTRGIALNVDDLRVFLESDICSILINTIVKKEVKKWVQETVPYITSQKFQMIPKFLEDYKISSKKEQEPLLKKLLEDYLVDFPDVNTVKLAKELPVIVSLLYLHQDVGLVDPLNI